MRKTGIIFFFILLFLLSVSALLLLHFFPDVFFEPEAEPEPVVAHVVEEGQSAYRICADRKDCAAAMSARYLAWLISERMGIDIPAVTGESGEDGLHIILRSDSAEDDSAPYEIKLEENGDIIFSFRAGDKNFACAKALFERWLSEDCGIQGNSLLLDQERIDTGFSELSFDLDGMMRILSQNICYVSDPDGNSVAERAPRFMQLVEQYAPDIVGMQEVSEEWRGILVGNLSDRYEFFGCSQYGYESTDGYGNFILFRRERFVFLNGGTFWLSDTPEEEASVLGGFWDSPRCCTWALMKDMETGKLFYLGNTHLHPGGKSEDEKIRIRELEILCTCMEQQYAHFGEYPVFLVGDFNSNPARDFYLDFIQFYKDSASEALSRKSDVDYTYHGYKSSRYLLDYCFFRGDNVVIPYQHIANDMFGGYVSDHYGLVTDVYMY